MPSWRRVASTRNRLGVENAMAVPTCADLSITDVDENRRITCMNRPSTSNDQGKSSCRHSTLG